MKSKVYIINNSGHDCYYDPKDVYGIIIDLSIFRKPNKQGISQNDHNRIPCPKNPEHLSSWLYETNIIFDRLENDFDMLYNEKENQPFMKSFMRNRESCVKYNRICEFWDICHAWNNPLQHLNEIPMGYKIEHWDCRKE